MTHSLARPLTLLLFAGMFAGSTVCWALLNPKGTLFEEK